MNAFPPPVAEVFSCGTKSVAYATSANSRFLFSMKRPFAEGQQVLSEGEAVTDIRFATALAFRSSSPFPAADSKGVSVMDYDALTRRDINVKNHVVEQLKSLDSKRRLYQVWQPSPFTWSVAMERHHEDPNPMPCLSDYLEFPADYSLVGLVEAFNMSHAYACMNHLDEDMQGEHVTLLAHHLRSGSPGDVIVPPRGLPHLVTSSGFQMLGRLHS